MTIHIDYDRKAKQYTWLDEASGEIVSAPSGKAHRAQLWKTAVALTDPDLYAAARSIIEKHPQLERVTWKAVELVVNDAVEVYPMPRGGVAAMVDGSDEYGRYALELTEYGLTCQCIHFQDGHAPLTETGSRYCKHILAYHLWAITRAEW